MAELSFSIFSFGFFYTLSFHSISVLNAFKTDKKSSGRLDFESFDLTTFTSLLFGK